MENEFNDDSSFKSLEDFFDKKISNLLIPQEIIVISLSLAHIAKLLSLYKQYANIAVFDVKAFIAQHPEHANIDFDNLGDLDEETIESIGKVLHDKDGHDGEEFNKGDILLNSIITVILNIALKLQDSYVNEYDKVAPEDTMQFFTMLDNCLQGSLTLLQGFLTQHI